jgi:hypothetical protein
VKPPEFNGKNGSTLARRLPTIDGACFFMINHFELFEQAVRTLITAEWENYEAGIHRPGAKRAEASRQRDERMNAIHAHLAAIRRVGTDHRFSLETVEARLRELARVCDGLTIWNQLCPRPDPTDLIPQETDLYQIAIDADSEAEAILATMCEKVLRALHEVLDLAAAPAGNQQDASHSVDFRSATWYGVDHSFTGNQAACVKTLWEAWENGTPEVAGDTLAVEADIQTKRLDHVFRNHPAWGTMIFAGKTKGTYRLVPPEQK